MAQWIFSLCILLGVFFPGVVRAQASAKVQGILLNADSMFRDSENETMELEGNVQIVFQSQHIKADKAHVNFRNRQAQLTGHVEIASPKTTVGGTAATLDYENNTGVVYDGFVQSGQVAFSGAILQKVSEDEYYVSNADYTTCTNCPSTWGFSGSNIRAELGRYAYIKNSILKIYSVPVLWLPYLIVPLKSDRQSGVLPPRFLSDSAGGLAISESYFWALSRNTDATAGLTNYEKRGLKGFGEYRYMLNENSYGNLSAAALVDRVFKNDPRVTGYESDTTKNKDITRWYTKYEHYYDMPGGYIQRTQINLASDLQYPKDFSEETGNFGDPAMDNRISLTKNSFANHFSAESSYYVNVLQSDPLASNANAVHRVPEIRLAQTQQKIANSQLLYSYNVDYVNFARGGQGFDNMTVSNGVRYMTNTCNDPKRYDNDPSCKIIQDSQYDPTTDLLRTGQRLDLTGTISRPILIGDYLDILPSLSYRETDYQFNAGEDRSNVRRYLRATLGLKTSMSRVFTTGEGPKTDKYKHEIVPEVIGTAIPWLYHPSHPFFGTDSDPDPTYYYTDYLGDNDVSGTHGVQFDYSDRVYDRGLITFALNNKLVQKKWVGDLPQYFQIASLKIYQSYDTHQANLRDPSRTPWSDLTAILDMRFPQFQTDTTLTYLEDLARTNVNSRVRLLNEFGQFFQVQWTKTYQRPQQGQVVDLEKSRVEDYTFGAGFQSGYLNLMGKFVYNANWANTTPQKKITSWAYVAQLKPPGDCWVINFTQYLTTDGNIKLFVDFAFNYDGTPKPALPPEELDKYGF
jgi:LPS-assembly protein